MSKMPVKAILLAALAIPLGVQAENSFIDLAMTSPNQILALRVGAPEPMAYYVGDLTSLVLGAQLPNGSVSTFCDVAIVVKPGQRSKYWITCQDTAVELQLDSKISAGFAAIKPPPVLFGPYAFSMRFAINPTPFVKDRLGRPPVMPKAWKNAAKAQGRSLRIPEELMPYVWPDSGVVTLRHDSLPEGFIEQPVEGTEGWIVRRKDWSYSWVIDKGAAVWTISKEKHDINSDFKTGYRLHFTPRFSTTASKDIDVRVQEMAEDFKRNSKMISECKSAQPGDAKVLCLEKTESPAGSDSSQAIHHRYIIRWSRELDYILVAKAKSPEPEWKNYEVEFRLAENSNLVPAFYSTK